MTTIHGIPIHRLASSGFWPAIKVLVESWEKRNDIPPLEFSRVGEQLSFLAITLVIPTLCFDLLYPGREVLVWLSFTPILLFLLFGLVLSLFASSFSRTVHRLDQALHEAGVGLQLFELGKTQEEIQKQLDKALLNIALGVLQNEGEHSLTDAAEEFRLLYRQLEAAIVELGLNFRSRKQVFAEAKLILESRKPGVVSNK